MLSPRNVQRDVFCAHLEFARECNLPCIIHVRDAHDDVMELLHAHGRDLRGVFHCFSGDVAQARECLAFEGFMLSFAGPLTKQGNVLPEVARMVPLDRVLIETDSPYLVPKPQHAKRNEPASKPEQRHQLPGFLLCHRVTVAPGRVRSGRARAA